MPKNNLSQPVHKHVIVMAFASILVGIFGLIVYPKFAVLAQTPTKPQDLSIVVDRENAVATWSVPALDGGSNITGYSILYYPTSDPTDSRSDLLSDATLSYSILLADLVPSLEYTFEVSAINAEGQGDLNTAVFNVPGSIPSAPQNCSATPGDALVTVSCELPLDLAGADMQSYIIYYGTKEYTTIEIPGTKGLTYVLDKLTNNTSYNFYVTVKNSNNVEGSASDVFSAIPTDGGGGGGGDPLEISTEPSVTTTSTTATIHWTTNKEASSIVYYGPTEYIKGVSPETNTTPRVTNHQTIISGLLACTKYWFKSESFDADGNSVQSLGGEFKTEGCKGDSTIIVADVKTVTAVTGATASAKVSGKGITAVAPAALKDGLDIAIEALKLEQDKVSEAISAPTGKNWVGDNAYSLKALQDETTEVSGSFDQSVSVSIDYTDADLEGFDISTLKIYHYEDATGWQPLTNCSNDYDSLSGTGTVTCSTLSFSIFGLFAQEEGTTSGSAPYRTNSTSNNNTNTDQIPENKPAPSDSGLLNKFTKDLSFGMVDSEVKMLQKFLNNQGFILASSGFGSAGNETNYFGPKTLNALKSFQEFYKDQILVPLGLSSPTGYFGEKTRNFINNF